MIRGRRVRWDLQVAHFGAVDRDLLLFFFLLLLSQLLLVASPAKHTQPSTVDTIFFKITLDVQARVLRGHDSLGQRKLARALLFAHGWCGK